MKILTKDEAFRALDDGEKITSDFFILGEYIHKVNGVIFYRTGEKVSDYVLIGTFDGKNLRIYEEASTGIDKQIEDKKVEIEDKIRELEELEDKVQKEEMKLLVIRELQELNVTDEYDVSVIADSIVDGHLNRIVTRDY